MDKYGCIWEDENQTQLYQVHLPEHDLHKGRKCNFFDPAQDYKAGAPMIVTARQLALSEDYSETVLILKHTKCRDRSLTDITTNFAVSRLP